MTGAEIERVQTYLRRLLGNDRLTIVPPIKPGFPVEVAVAGETIGTCDKDTDEGEVSYAVTLTILDEDSAAAAQGGAEACDQGGAPPRLTVRRPGNSQGATRPVEAEGVGLAPAFTQLPLSGTALGSRLERRTNMAQQHTGNPGNFAEDREKAAEAGRKGGQHSGGNFANDRERAAEAGHKGGQHSGGNFADDRERAAEAGHKAGRIAAATLPRIVSVRRRPGARAAITNKAASR